MDNKLRIRQWLLWGLMIVSGMIMLLWDMDYEIFNYLFSKRLIKLCAIVIVGIAVGTSTTAFQSITGNRLLTPGILGLDALFILIQLVTSIMFGRIFNDNYFNFGISVVLMLILSHLFYIKVFSSGKSVHFIILLGVVLGTLINSLSGVIQLTLSPDAYELVLNRLFANFSAVNGDLLLVSAIITLVVTIAAFRRAPTLDVLSLGRTSAVNLGVDYNKEAKEVLIGVFLLTAVSTALVGPITFLGFFAVNIAKSALSTYKHVILLTGTIQISVVMLITGQFLIERWLQYAVPVSVVINMIGGGYFILLMMKLNSRSEPA